MEIPGRQRVIEDRSNASLGGGPTFHNNLKFNFENIVR